ncbi:MAG: hypothetical protein ACI8PZ_006685 [Myxococcota bacterium]|jgi:hypothetical protein
MLRHAVNNAVFSSRFTLRPLCAVGTALALVVSASASAAPCPADTVGFNGACHTMPFFEGMVAGMVYRVDGSASSEGTRVVLTRLLPDGAEVLTVASTPAGPQWTGPVAGPFRVVKRWSHQFVADAGEVSETVTDGQAGLDGWSEDSVTTDWTDADNGIRCDEDSCEAVSAPGGGALDAVQNRMAVGTSRQSTGACLVATEDSDAEEASIGEEGASQCATTYGILGVDDVFAELFGWLAGEECQAGNELVFVINHKMMCAGWEVVECHEYRVYETTADCGVEYVSSTDNCDCPEELPDWT